jgi:hypothetical protein
MILNTNDLDVAAPEKLALSRHSVGIFHASEMKNAT